MQVIGAYYQPRRGKSQPSAVVQILELWPVKAYRGPKEPTFYRAPYYDFVM